MTKETILYYLLSNPQKIDEYGFRADYLDSGIHQMIFRELNDECRKFNQIIPKSEAEKMFVSHRFDNFRNAILVTLTTMYDKAPDELESGTEAELDYYIKKMIFDSQRTNIKNVLDSAKSVIDSSLGLTQEGLNRYLNKDFKKLDYCFNDEEKLKEFKGLFDPVFEEGIEENEQIPVGIEGIDLYTGGGFRKRTVSVIQAGTGKGKTTMLISLAANMLLTGKNVAFINLEMLEHELQFNVYSALQTKYSYTEIRNNYKKENPDFITDLQKEIYSKAPGYFYSLKSKSFESLDCMAIEQVLLEHEESTGIKFDTVMIDYIGLMKAYLVEHQFDRSDQAAQRTMREFKIMCERNNWCGITAVQSNRSGLGVEGKTSEGGANAMGFVSNSFAQLFEIDNFISFSQVTDTDKIRISFNKARQWHSVQSKEDFLMKYSERQKRYVNTDEKLPANELSYKNICDILRPYLLQKDIISICEKFSYCTGRTVKLYYEKKGWKGKPANPVKVNIDDITNINEFIARFRDNNGLQIGMNNTDIMTIDPLNDEKNKIDLFTI